jgi:Dolichyl-phosphate-mannose-protein mannosyltransferase
MQTREADIQGLVHSLEQGKAAGLFRLCLSILAVIAFALSYLLLQFRGLSTPAGIDQAQIARELSRGNGFSTKDIRPLEAELLQKRFGQVPPGNVPELYHAPLNPVVNAGALYLLSSVLHLKVDQTDPVYRGDRLIAAVSILFFLLAAWVNFLVAQLLFDRKVALLATGLVLIADQFWQFSLSGLPQMLLLFLLSGSLWCLAKAVIGRKNDQKPYRWLVLLGLFQGALALTHPITLWFSSASWLFCFIYFRPRLPGVLLAPLLCLALFSVWIARDLKVSRTPFGSAPIALLDNIGHTETGWMRLDGFDRSEITIQAIRERVVTNFKEQLGSIYGLLGSISVSPLFLAALLYRFKRSDTNAFKWLLLLLLIGAFAGSVLTGTNGASISPNQTLILMGPAIAIYGLAMVLVLVNRLNLGLSLYRHATLTAFFLITGLPTLLGFLPNPVPIQFPPYAPALMKQIGAWTKPDEIVASDMPWAVAWYSDRKSLLLPWDRKRFYGYHDLESLGGPIVCLYLTPITLDKKLSSDITLGEYKDWATILLGLPQGLDDFPLQSHIGLAENRCLLLMDRDRWKTADAK